MADRLMSSLDSDMLNDVNEGWITEAERRYQLYKKGKRAGIDTKTVFLEADRS